MRTVWTKVLLCLWATAIVPPSLAAETWPEKRIQPPKEWKSQQVCGFEINYPSDALLDIRQKGAGECPGTFDLVIHGSNSISFDAQPISDKDWLAHAAQTALLFCSADGPDESRFCDPDQASSETFTIDGQRALKIKAPITIETPKSKTVDGSYTFYVVELSTNDSTGEPLGLIAYSPDSQATDVLDVLDSVVKSLRFRNLTTPTTSQKANRENDRTTLDAIALAKGPKKERREFDGYILEATLPALKECLLGTNYSDKCYPENLPAKIFRPDKTLMTAIDDVYWAHYHPFEVHGQKVYWIFRNSGDCKSVDQNCRTWTDEIWTMDTATNKKERLATARGIDFRASPTGKSLIYVDGTKLMKFDLETKKTDAIFDAVDMDVDHIIDMSEFSPNGEEFYFSIDSGTSCVKAATYRNGKLSWHACG